MSGKTLAAVAAFCLFTLFIIAGTSHAASPDEAYNKTSSALYAKAKQEGELIVYTVWDVEHIVAILQGFSKKYPGIKTTYWQGRNPEIVTRTITEFRANRASVDAILSDNAPPVLRAAGAIMPYETAQKEALLIHDPTMPVVSLQVQALTYNTKRIKAPELPKSWENVATPKYKGMVALDDPMRAGPLSTQLAALKDFWKDEAKWSAFVKGLKALNVPVHKSTSAMFRLVIAGEYAIAMPALLHDVMNEKEKGTPVEYIKTATPIVFPRYAAVYAKAPHPNAAKLLTEWLISPDGQATLDSVGREASRKGFPSKTSIENAYGTGTQPVAVHDKLFMEDPQKWLDMHVKPIWAK
ncbi:MAG: extracellular solute-binding protein [Deltaproteobacteria bacterium]|nr:extracellular solute-binding protein [Deltaproteobacteria bacterium]